MNMDEFIVSASAMLPIVTALIVCAKPSNRLGLIHFYLIMVALFYGAHTILDVVFNGVAEVDLFTVIVLMISISASMILMNVLFYSLPWQVRNRLRVDYLIQEVGKTPFAIIAVCWLLLVSWFLFMYYRYGIFKNYDVGTMMSFSSVYIPSWVNPARSLFISTSFSICIILFVSLLKERRFKFLSIHTFMLIVLVIFLIIDGRRNFLHLIVVGGIIFIAIRERSKQLLTKKNIMRGAVALLVLVLYSNLYQTFRTIYPQNAALRTENSVETDWSDALLNFEITAENLEHRHGPWRFHSWVMNEQLRSPTNIMGGTLLWGAAVSSIPRAIWPEKGNAISEDFEICSFYQTICPRERLWSRNIDYPQTIYSVLQADFGFFFIIIAPFFVLVTLLTVSYLGRFPNRNHTSRLIYLIVFGLNAHFLINVEQNILSVFMYLRNVVMVVIIIKSASFFYRKRGRRTILIENSWQ